jgi:hypothetical protein
MLPELPKLGVARPDAHVMVQHLPQKNSLFRAKSRKQRSGIFLAS